MLLAPGDDAGQAEVQQNCQHSRSTCQFPFKCAARTYPSGSTLGLKRAPFSSTTASLPHIHHLFSYPPRYARSKYQPCTFQRSTWQPLRSPPSLPSLFGLGIPTSPCQRPVLFPTMIVSTSRGKPSHRYVLLYEYLATSEKNLF